VRRRRKRLKHGNAGHHIDQQHRGTLVRRRRVADRPRGAFRLGGLGLGLRRLGGGLKAAARHERLEELLGDGALEGDVHLLTPALEGAVALQEVEYGNSEDQENKRNEHASGRWGWLLSHITRLDRRP
jgi:hypothetical protein